MVRNMVDLSQIAHDGCTFTKDKITILHMLDQLGAELLLQPTKLYSFGTFRQGILANGLLLVNSLLRASPAVTLTKRSSTLRPLILPNIDMANSLVCVTPTAAARGQRMTQHMKGRRYLQKRTHALAGCDSKSINKVIMSTACYALQIRDHKCCNIIVLLMTNSILLTDMLM